MKYTKTKWLTIEIIHLIAEIPHTFQVLRCDRCWYRSTVCAMKGLVRNIDDKWDGFPRQIRLQMGTTEVCEGVKVIGLGIRTEKWESLWIFGWHFSSAIQKTHRTTHSGQNFHFSFLFYLTMFLLVSWRQQFQGAVYLIFTLSGMIVTHIFVINRFLEQSHAGYQQDSLLPL